MMNKTEVIKLSLIFKCFITNIDELLNSKNEIEFIANKLNFFLSLE